MHSRWIVAGLAVLALAGCARGGDGPRPMPIESDSISYQTGPCFGACPVYSVTVRPDGTGVFNGIQHTKVSGERSFKLSPAQYQAFAAALSPYRPETGERSVEPGKPGCQLAATDHPSVDVRWTRMIGDSQHLHFYFGCHDEPNRPMADALGNAPDVLPIAELVGERP